MEKEERIGQDQFFDLITGEEVSWQAIIYDLVKSEQLDPWDIDLGVLAEKYAETIEKLEEADFFVSSKVLLACSLLLRLKSEVLLNDYIVSLDEALYGKKPENSYEVEKIEIDEDELPVLVPRTPMPRYKKVTLNQLMGALNKAIETENRRIKKEIKKKQAKKSANIVLPKGSKIPLKHRIKGIFSKIKFHVSSGKKRVGFSELAASRDEKLSSFLPVLHLTNDEKIYVHQEVHFEEIWMGFEKPDYNDDFLEEIDSEEQ